VKERVKAARGRGVGRVEHGHHRHRPVGGMKHETGAQRGVGHRRPHDRVEHEAHVRELGLAPAVGEGVHVAIERVHLAREHGERVGQLLREQDVRQIHLLAVVDRQVGDQRRRDELARSRRSRYRWRSPCCRRGWSDRRRPAGRGIRPPTPADAVPSHTAAPRDRAAAGLPPRPARRGTTRAPRPAAPAACRSPATAGARRQARRSVASEPPLPPGPFHRHHRRSHGAGFGESSALGEPARRRPSLANPAARRRPGAVPRPGITVRAVAATNRAATPRSRARR
jgi:hypothetical protein